MKRNLISLCALLLMAMAASAQKTQIEPVVFPKGGDSPSLEEEERVLDLLESIHANHLIVNCFLPPDTSPNGERLQRRRATSLSLILDANGWATDRIVFHTDPSHFPEYTHARGVGDYLYLEIKTEIPPAKPITPIGEQQVANAFSPPTDDKEIRELDSDKSHTLFLKKGCILDIPAHAFQLPDGTPYEGKVVFESLEVLDIATAFLHDMATVSPEGILQSRGMISMAASTPTGDELQLRPGYSIGVNIPRPKNAADDEDFMLYKEERPSGLNDREMRWLLQGRSKPQPIKRASSVRIRYEWGYLSEETRQEITEEKNAIIKKWEEKGRSQKSIRRSIKRAKQRVKRSNDRRKERWKRYRRKHGKYSYKEYKRLKRNIDGRQPKLSQSWILAETKKHWVIRDTLRSKLRDYYRFDAIGLGGYNIDRLYKTEEPVDLLVHSFEDASVKILFKKDFILLRGQPLLEKGAYRLENIPAKDEVVAIATKELPDGRIQVAHADCEGGDGYLSLPPPRIMSKEDFFRWVEELSAARWAG